MWRPGEGTLPGALFPAGGLRLRDKSAMFVRCYLQWCFQEHKCLSLYFHQTTYYWCRPAGSVKPMAASGSPYGPVQGPSRILPSNAAGILDGKAGAAWQRTPKPVGPPVVVLKGARLFLSEIRVQSPIRTRHTSPQAAGALGTNSSSAASFSSMLQSSSTFNWFKRRCK